MFCWKTMFMVSLRWVTRTSLATLLHTMEVSFMPTHWVSGWHSPLLPFLFLYPHPFASFPSWEQLIELSLFHSQVEEADSVELSWVFLHFPGSQGYELISRSSAVHPHHWGTVTPTHAWKCSTELWWGLLTSTSHPGLALVCPLACPLALPVLSEKKLFYRVDFPM